MVTPVAFVAGVFALLMYNVYSLRIDMELLY